MSPQEPKLTSYKLAQLQLEIVHLMERGASEEDPEQLEQIAQRVLELYEQLGEKPEEKLAALRAVVLRVEAEVASIAKEVKQLEASNRARRKTIERLKGLSAVLMRGIAETKGITKIVLEGHTYWTARVWSMSAPSGVGDWPEEWQRTVTTVVADRGVAREALKGGAPVPDGWSWEPVEGIRWR